MRRRLLPLLASALAGVLAFPAPSSAGATITIVNVDGPGEGFNDPTPAVPVGGNPGTTIGEQRLIAFQYAANLWGAQLDSPAQIFVTAAFNPLSCTATSAVLGSAGTTFIFRDFPGFDVLAPGAEFPGTWYHSALADKRAGTDVNPGFADLGAQFNTNLGAANCLAGSGWYYGLDENGPANLIDLVTVLLHEFAHGLGFSQFASVTGGAMPQGLPDVYNRRLLDLTSGLYWPQMTNAQRVASAINSRRVVFDGPAVSSAIPGVLNAGTPLLDVDAPAAIAGVYAVGAAAFGPPLGSPGVSGMVVLGLDPADAAGPATTDACSPLTNAAAVAGNIALVDRGACGFTIKVKNAQDAGAIAVIVADNVAGSPPPGLGGADPSIVIPSVRITLADGNTIKAQLGAGVTATLGVDLNVFAGADPLGRALVNAPNPVQPGSSISHYDPIATPNQLMEPSINADLTHSVKPPEDLSLPLMRDVGWFPDADLDGLDDGIDSCLGSTLGGNVIVGGTDTGVPNLLFTNGCTIQDRVTACSAAPTHGLFVGCLATFLDALEANGILTSAQKDAIVKAAARNR